MTVINIRNRIGRLEQEQGVGRRRVVVIMPRESDEAAFARAGVELGDDVHVIRVNVVHRLAA